MSRFRKSGLPLLLVLMTFFGGVFPVKAQQGNRDFDALKREIDELRRLLTEKSKKLEELERKIAEIQASKPPEKSSAETAAAPESPKTAPSPSEQEQRRDLLSYRKGGATFRLIDLSLDAMVASGASTERDKRLQNLQGGGHDPRKRGFTIQNVELSFMGAVDPYFNAEAHVIYFIEPLTGESRFELEEAFLTTQKLPYGLQLEAGQFFTEFGRINAQHPHEWQWQDQPVINTRFFGPDGMRAPGFRLGWLTPLPWFSELHFGMQNANGETMASFLANEEFFEERPIGGRPFVDRDVRSLKDLVYLGRWDNSWDLSDEWTLKMGLSGLFGPNATGPGGKTRIYGTDFKLKWRPAAHHGGWPFLLLESEVMKRDYHADRFFNPGPDGIPGTADEVSLPSDTLKDWGFYAQALYGFLRDWAAGIRYEFATGSGDSLNVNLGTGIVRRVGRNADPFRDDRHRISPLLAWHPTEFSRLRLQYNYDRFKHLGGRDAHSVWLGAEVMLGAHPAHKY